MKIAASSIRILWEGETFYCLSSLSCVHIKFDTIPVCIGTKLVMSLVYLSKMMSYQLENGGLLDLLWSEKTSN